MIEIEDLTFRYADNESPVLKNVNLSIEDGEFVLITGVTGTGKSTLLGTLNGLVPTFTGGHLTGDVRIDGLSTRNHPPRDFANLVGWVGQDPLSGFVTDIVEDELAYGMEQLGYDHQVMRRRVEETLDLLGIEDLRQRPLRTLSGGQAQRVAIGSVLTMHPKALVLDEPTSALDPTAAEDVLATLARLVTDLGTTVLVAEHRLERVIPFVDQTVLLEGDGSLRQGTPVEVLAHSPLAPPLLQLASIAGWDPPLVTVRDARRHAGDIRTRLASAVSSRTASSAVAPALHATGIVVRYGSTVAVRDITVTLNTGTVVALMGRNGSGKSSLLWALQGSGPRDEGTVTVAGQDPAMLSPERARGLVGLVPQTPGDLLYFDSVGAECTAADTDADASPGTCAKMLNRIAPDIDASRHPRDLSEGQRLALVLAIQLSAAPEVILLDEPTRGLDGSAKRAFVTLIRELADQGHAVVVATHDVELVAHLADRVIVMAQGEIVSDGDTTTVLSASPSFAPQVCKVLGEPWMTVDQVAHALGPNS